MWRLLTLAVAVLALPLAASAPIAYFGVGSGTKDRPWDLIGFTDLYDEPPCVRADVLVTVVHDAEGQWIPEVDHVDRYENGLPCNVSGRTPLENPVWPVELQGSPGEGFFIDFSPEDPCAVDTVTIAPLGKATDLRIVATDCTLPYDDTWINATVDFSRIG